MSDQNNYQTPYQPQPPQPYQQNGYQQSSYQQPVYQQPGYPQAVDPTREVMSIGSYLGVFFLSSIPVVNFICWIVWLASSNTNKNKKNYIIACIIYSLIISVISGIVFAILMAAGVLAGNEFINF